MPDPTPTTVDLIPCKGCGALFVRIPMGAGRLYCTDACRVRFKQRQYGKRVNPKTGTTNNQRRYMKWKKKMAREICNG